MSTEPDEPEEYCVVHDRRIRMCEFPDRCREVMRGWGLYRDEAADSQFPAGNCDLPGRNVSTPAYGAPVGTFPVDPADVPDAAVRAVRRTLLRHGPGGMPEADPMDDDLARLIVAVVIAALAQPEAVNSGSSAPAEVRKSVPDGTAFPLEPGR